MWLVRRVRIDNSNPLREFMKDQGILSEECVTRPDNTTIFSFPVKSPNGVMTYENYNPIKHLELWLTYQKYWCDHKPSVTINYSDNDFLEVGQWVYNNWNLISGISFLPNNDHIYEQAPFEAIDEDTYFEMEASMPNQIDWSNLSIYELEDTTANSHTLACHGGACDIVDLVEK